MAEAERELIQTRLHLLEKNQRRFRINAGQGWAGDIVKQTPEMIVIKNPRVFHGAPKGWPDLCGWDEIEITLDMVGTRVAVFVGEEFKTKGVRMSKEQTIFQRVLTAMGGIFKIIRE
jgi:hypothetical protein